jgi:hypothetical protein
MEAFPFMTDEVTGYTAYYVCTARISHPVLLPTPVNATGNSGPPPSAGRLGPVIGQPSL